MKRWHRVAFSAAVLLAVTCAGALAWAPYLPRLVTEGFPAPVWPAAGSFVKLAGVAVIASTEAKPADIGTFDPQLKTLLEGRDAKAFLVSQKGRIAIEYYGDGMTAQTRFNSYSLVKSLIGALTVKAVADARIASLDDPLGTYLDDLGMPSLRAVPIRGFLEMRSGVLFEAGETKSLSGTSEKDLEGAFANPFGPLVRLHMQGLGALAGDLTSHSDGQGRFSYQNINTAILGALLERVYERALPDILSEKIWKPAGAADAWWRTYSHGTSVSAYCCLYATARDWLKVATYLNRNGSSGGSPFLSTELWQQLLGAQFTDAELHQGQYGLHLRHDILDRPGEPLQGAFSYFLGHGGQIVYLMPQQDFAVVRFGEGAQLLHSTLYATWRTLQMKAPN